jgi:hypothetical protein
MRKLVGRYVRRVYLNRDSPRNSPSALETLEGLQEIICVCCDLIAVQRTAVHSVATLHPARLLAALNSSVVAKRRTTYRRPRRDENLRVLVDGLDVVEDGEHARWDIGNTEAAQAGITAGVVEAVVHCAIVTRANRYTDDVEASGLRAVGGYGQQP